MSEIESRHGETKLITRSVGHKLTSSSQLLAMFQVCWRSHGRSVHRKPPERIGTSAPISLQRRCLISTPVSRYLWRIRSCAALFGSVNEADTSMIFQSRLRNSAEEANREAKTQKGACALFDSEWRLCICSGWSRYRNDSTIVSTKLRRSECRNKCTTGISMHASPMRPVGISIHLMIRERRYILALDLMIGL